MIKLLVATSFFLYSSTPVWLTDFETAKAQAKKEHKLILLSFSGSDWCIPCISLHKEVFESAIFLRYAEENIILVNADFPRNKKNQLSKEQQKVNDALAEKYNPTGNFPYTLLLDSDGNKIKVWDGFYKKGAENFIAEIKDAAGLK